MNHHLELDFPVLIWQPHLQRFLAPPSPKSLSFPSAGNHLQCPGGLGEGLVPRVEVTASQRVYSPPQGLSSDSLFCSLLPPSSNKSPCCCTEGQLSTEIRLVLSFLQSRFSIWFNIWHVCYLQISVGQLKSTAVNSHAMSMHGSSCAQWKEDGPQSNDLFSRD